MSQLESFYKDKKVFITGHTGFKGSWLSAWLLKLGAEVHGFAKNIPTEPSVYKLTGLTRFIHSNEGDILDHDRLWKAIEAVKPDIIFHTAAQPITTLAFEQPLQTFETNVIGTASVLDAVRKLDHACTVVCITSDKSYLNKEWVWGYRETDELGGKDPYSGSKAGAEMVIRSYYHTFFKNDNGKRVAAVRAGNIIGGGDWATNRIVPDCIRAWQTNEPVVIRSPKAIRPWQHVIEPIYGYMLLAKKLHQDENLNGEAFNFGPDPMHFKTVLELVELLAGSMRKNGVKAIVKVEDANDQREAGILKLNCEKALSPLNWRPVLSIEESMELTADWYFGSLWKQSDALNLCHQQLSRFEAKL
ncbi:MAG: hypothetical protein RL266_2862 [Bacteroidota bacterium]